MKREPLKIFFRILQFHAEHSHLKTLQPLWRKISFAKQSVLTWIDMVLGTILGIFITFFERLRVGWFNLKNRLETLKTISEIWEKSQHLLFNLFLISVFFFILDFKFIPYFNEYINSHIPKLSYVFSYLPSLDFSKDMFQTFLSTIAILLGIIFALFIFGFQNIAEKHSGDVIKYISQEPVSLRFFKILIFSVLFNIVFLILTAAFDQSPFFSLIFGSILTVTSFLAILVLKNHYFFSVQPEYIFQRLASDIGKEISAAHKTDISETSSWSVIIGNRHAIKEHLKIMSELLDDLIRLNKFDDISYGVNSYAAVIVHYLDLKGGFSKENAYWYPYKKELASEHDYAASFEMKQNYEAKGIGPLFLDKDLDYYWLENVIIEKFKELTASGKLPSLSPVINAISTVLNGLYKQDKTGKRVKEIRGAYDYYDFKCFNDFLILFKDATSALFTVDDENSFISWDNEAFRTIITVVDGYDDDEIDELIEIIYSRSRNEIQKESISIYFKDIAYEYEKMISLEREVENGEVITPKEWLKKDIISTIKRVKEEKNREALNILMDAIDVAVVSYRKSKSMDKLASLWLTELIVIRRFMHKEITYALDPFLELLRKHLSIFIEIGKDEAEEKQIIYNAEMNVFLCICEKSNELGKLLVETYILATVLGVKDLSQDKDTLRLRGLIHLGGFLYLCSEYYQDSTLLDFFIEKLRKIYSNLENSDFTKMLSSVNEHRPLTFIEPEIKRYQFYFNFVMKDIDDSLEKTFKKEDPPPSKHPLNSILFTSQYTEHIYDHPSVFIQGLAERVMPSMDRFLKAFINYVNNKYGDADEIQQTED